MEVASTTHWYRSSEAFIPRGYFAAGTFCLVQLLRPKTRTDPAFCPYQPGWGIGLQTG